LGSLLWFLVRVIPKPSRAAYPCQRAAAPAASAFVLWLMAILAAKWALVRQRRLASLRTNPALLWIGGAVLGLSVLAALVSLPHNTTLGGPSELHGPLGAGKGIHPGRVVWVHAPDATDWAGFSSAEYWWQSNHTSLAVVEDMVSEGIRRLTGEGSDAAAWAALFSHFNEAQGRGHRGYQAGEKVAIKLNLTTCNAGGDGVDPDTYEKTRDVMNTIDNSPQMLISLLRHLVYTAGVKPEDISLGDPTALFPQFLWNILRAEFPGVNCFDPRGISGRKQVVFTQKRLFWSTAEATGKLPDYLPAPWAEADYLINFAILKGHSSGVTVCGKNLYGALLRCPAGYLYDEGVLDYYNLHLSLPNAGWSPGMGHYRAVVDLMGHRELGAKTLLYLVDGLYAGYYWDSKPSKWKTAPFGTAENPDWPSSLLLSQDPVAIDSVAYDLLLNEWPRVVNNGTGPAGSLQGGAEDYLHEAALADAPPSGTVYDPEQDGVRMASLGVHEHWNNPTDRQYTRNRGGTNGIELVYSRLDRPTPRLAMERAGNTVTLSWPSSHTGYTLQSAADPAVPDAWAPVAQTPVLFQARYAVSNAPIEGMRFFRLAR
jgi:hypothetical protein